MTASVELKSEPNLNPAEDDFLHDLARDMLPTELRSTITDKEIEEMVINFQDLSRSMIRKQN